MPSIEEILSGLKVKSELAPSPGEQPAEDGDSTVPMTPQAGRGGLPPIEQAVAEIRASRGQAPDTQVERQTPTGSFGQETYQTSDSYGDKSPLSILERMKLSFADDAGREKYLRNKFSIVERLPNGKFAVGNNPNELSPIDPEGIFNDVIGDIADVVSEIPVIASQIAGSLAGATLGAGAGGIGAVPGGISGGAAGAATGQGIKQAIGHTMGVRESKAFEEATNIAVAGAFGAAGEALIPASQWVGKTLTSKLTNELGKQAIKSSIATGVPIEETMMVKGIAKMLSVMSNVKEDSVKTAFKYGIEEVLGNNPGTKPEAIIPIVRKVIDNLEKARIKLGDDVEIQKKAFASLANKNKQDIKVGNLVEGIVSDAQKIGIITPAREINKAANVVNGEDVKLIKVLLQDLGAISKDPAYGGPGVITKNLGKTIKAEDAINVIMRYSQRYDKVSPNVQGILHKFLGADKTLKTPGLRHVTRDLAKKLGMERYATVLDDFGDFAGTQIQLRNLNLERPSDVETFIGNLENMGMFDKMYLKKLDGYTKTKLGSKSGFLRDMEIWNAAQDFSKAKPDMLRFGFIGGAISALSGTPLFTHPVAKLAGATLIATPAGNKILLRALARAGKAVKNIPRTVTGAKRILQREQEKELLNSLISSGMRQGVGVGQ